MSVCRVCVRLCDLCVLWESRPVYCTYWLRHQASNHGIMQRSVARKCGKDERKDKHKERVPEHKTLYDSSQYDLIRMRQ